MDITDEQAAKLGSGPIRITRGRRYLSPPHPRARKMRSGYIPDWDPAGESMEIPLDLLPEGFAGAGAGNGPLPMPPPATRSTANVIHMSSDDDVKLIESDAVIVPAPGAVSDFVHPDVKHRGEGAASKNGKTSDRKFAYFFYTLGLTDKHGVIQSFLHRRLIEAFSTGDLSQISRQGFQVAALHGQLEKGEGGHLHYQFCVRVDPRTRVANAHAAFAYAQDAGISMYCQPVRSIEKAMAYCVKEDTRFEGPWQIGTMVLPQGGRAGKRTDIEEAIEEAEAGGGLDSIAVRNPALFVRNYRGLGAALQSRARFAAPIIHNALPKIIVLVGKSGCGKTYYVTKLGEALGKKVYSKATENKWWDQYMGEEIVLFDEYTGHSELPLTQILKLCDYSRMSMQLEAKGTVTNLRATTIVFTSNIPLSDWWPKATDLQYAAFIRRINEGGGFVHYFSGVAPDPRVMSFKNPVPTSGIWAPVDMTPAPVPVFNPAGLLPVEDDPMPAPIAVLDPNAYNFGRVRTLSEESLHLSELDFAI
jgi:hypothetical protein